MIEKIKKLKNEGLSLRKIANKLNISLGKVQRTLKSVSIQKRYDTEAIQTDTEEKKRIDTDRYNTLKKEIEGLKKDIFRLNSKLLMSDEGFDEDKFKLIFASLDIINKHFFLKDQTYYSKHSLKIDKMVKEWENEGKNKRTLREVLNDSIK